MADLSAEGRLGDEQGRGGATEVPVIGDGDEVPHKPQVEVNRGRRRVSHTVKHSSLAATMCKLHCRAGRRPFLG
jgi:hypothetical protein